MKPHLLRILLFTTLFFSLLACGQEEKLTIEMNNKKIDVNDSSSEFFHEDIREQLFEKDTTLSPKQILSYTLYVRNYTSFNPGELDELAKKMYGYNEKGLYEKALVLAEKIRKISPGNISALKEMSFAYQRLGREAELKKSFALMVLAIKAAKLSGDGTWKKPYILTNSYELTSLIEASYGLFPEQKLIRDSTRRILSMQFVPRMFLLFTDVPACDAYNKKATFVDLDKEEMRDSEIEKILLEAGE